MYDIIIIGAGPAGLTAAIYSLRAGKSVLLLDKGAFGGQITFSPKIENYPGFESISGAELADKMVEQALALGADVEVEKAVGIEVCGADKKISTEEGNEYTAKAVIIACGAKHRHLGAENEEKFLGDGISFCAVCDGAFYEGKTVGLVGGGNSALQEAMLLSETCKKVYIIQNLDFLTGEKKLCEILDKRENVEIITGTVVEKILGDSVFEGVVTRRVADGAISELNLDGLFVAIGLAPENDDFKSVAELDSIGYIISNESCTTKTDGIFVAGDCRTKAIRQISTAVADGSISAISACRYIDSL